MSHKRFDRPTPEWFDRSKLGIFIHWTPASVPAFAPVVEPFGIDGEDDPAAGIDVHAMLRRNPFAEWYWNSMQLDGHPSRQHHLDTYGDLPYDAFVAQFRAGLAGWDPEPWAELFEQAGAGYVVLTSRHLDGFKLWPSSNPNPNRPDWQAERDVVGELAAAVRARGMKFAVYYGGGQEWTFGGLPIGDRPSMEAATPQSPEYLAYVEADWRELIERYGPSLLWNDMGWPEEGDLDSLFEFFYERVPDGLINNRFDWERQSKGEIHADFLTPEYSTKAPPDRKWEACRGLGTSFGYNREETAADYIEPAELINTFVDVVSRGGNLLLNVGPTAAGEIPWPQAQRLLALGWWLRANGDGVIGTRPWAGQGEEQEGVRFTTSEDGVNAIVLAVPTTTTCPLPLRLDPGAEVTLLGHTGALEWRPSEGGVEVVLPDSPPPSTPALTLRLTPEASVHPLAG